MLARKEQKDTVFSPGPGAYNPDGKLRKQIPISLTSRNFMKSANAGDPGPGERTVRSVSEPNRISILTELTNPCRSIHPSKPQFRQLAMDNARERGRRQESSADAWPT